MYVVRRNEKKARRLDLRADRIQSRWGRLYVAGWCSETTWRRKLRVATWLRVDAYRMRLRDEGA